MVLRVHANAVLAKSHKKSLFEASTLRHFSQRALRKRLKEDHRGLQTSDLLTTPGLHGAPPMMMAA